MTAAEVALAESAALEDRIRRLGIRVRPGALRPVSSSPSRPPVRRQPAAAVQSRKTERGWWSSPDGQDAELRRRLEAADYAEGSFELILEQMQDEIFFQRHGYSRKVAA